MNKKPKKILPILTAIFLFFWGTPVQAAALTSVSDTMSRLEEGVVADHLIKFTTLTGAGDVGDTITIAFPAGFTIGSVDYTDIDLQHGPTTGLETSETLAATADATSWGASFGGGQTLTLTHPTNGTTGDIAVSDIVTIKIGLNASGGNAQITNPGTNNTYILSLAGTFGDSGKLAVAILDSASDDVVTMDANVDPSITFSLSAHNSSFGTLSPGVVDTADTNVVLTVGTNSAGGYVINVRDTGNNANPGLYSAGANDIIGSADGSYNATADLANAGIAKGYGLQASCLTGCTTGTHIESKWRQASDTVGGLTLVAGTLATYNAALSGDHTIQVVAKAKAASTTKAGNYADTIYYIATGVF